LLRGLAAEFEGLGSRENVELTLSEGERREYVLYQKQYALTFHTFKYEGEVDPAVLMGQQIARLALLRRKLREELRAGEKIFVCKRNEALTEHEILPLYALLNRFGANTLLFVTPADAAHPPGTVERLMPGLLRGAIDRFAPSENAHDLSLEYWLAVCVNAYRLVNDAGRLSRFPRIRRTPPNIMAGEGRPSTFFLRDVTSVSSALQKVEPVASSGLSLGAQQGEKCCRASWF
jgi:hypothetical protein